MAAQSAAEQEQNTPTGPTVVEMKAIESILHLRREAPQRLKNMVPQHFWPLLARYGITPTEDERPLKKAP